MSEPVSGTKIYVFCERLGRLDNGERARLKRSAGQTLAGARREALGLFYSVVPPGVPPFEEDAYFLVATLYPLADSSKEGNMGQTLKNCISENNQKGVERRMRILLDADASQLPFRLRQAIRFIQSNREKVNWPRLLQDLLAWDSQDHYVQRRWARSFYVQSSQDSK